MPGWSFDIGSGVAMFTVGDEVLGFTNQRASHAQFVVVPASQLNAKSPTVSWDVAGTTAYAAVRAIQPAAGRRAPTVSSTRPWTFSVAAKWTSP